MSSRTAPRLIIQLNSDLVSLNDGNAAAKAQQMHQGMPVFIEEHRYNIWCNSTIERQFRQILTLLNQRYPGSENIFLKQLETFS